MDLFFDQSNRGSMSELCFDRPPVYTRKKFIDREEAMIHVRVVILCKTVFAASSCVRMYSSYTNLPSLPPPLLIRLKNGGLSGHLCRARMCTCTGSWPCPGLRRSAANNSLEQARRAAYAFRKFSGQLCVLALLRPNERLGHGYKHSPQYT